MGITTSISKNGGVSLYFIFLIPFHLCLYAAGLAVDKEFDIMVKTGVTSQGFYWGELSILIIVSFIALYIGRVQIWNEIDGCEESSEPHQ